jgi:hypothetical protein
MRPSPESLRPCPTAVRDKLPPPDPATASHREVLRARVAICAALRRTRASSAIGGTLAAALRLGDDAAAELARIPDSAELRRRDAALLERDADATADGFATKLGLLVEEYRNGRALDLFTASPNELLACCVARAGAVGAPG